MKKYTHAWLAMMAIKRLDMGNLPETEGAGKHPKEVHIEKKEPVSLDLFKEVLENSFKEEKKQEGK